LPWKSLHKGLLSFTIWKLERKTAKENRKTIIQRTIEMALFFFIWIISGRNFVKNRIKNKILNIDLSITEFASELLKPI